MPMFVILDILFIVMFNNIQGDSFSMCYFLKLYIYIYDLKSDHNRDINAAPTVAVELDIMSLQETFGHVSASVCHK